MTKYTLVTIEENETLVPQVLEDYIYSLNIFHEVIHKKDFSKQLMDSNDNIYVFTQMWLNVGEWLDVLDKSRIVFLNVEMLSEQNRMDQILKLLSKNIKIADYSFANIRFLLKFMHHHNFPYFNQLIYLPYQFNLKEQLILENKEEEYDYDVGIINALPKQDESVDSSNTYRRTNI